jgi:glycyl-tRNA synthetase (class II)
MHHCTSIFAFDFDESQSIGKRYRRQDEIGTPYCITFDFDSLEDNGLVLIIHFLLECHFFC